MKQKELISKIHATLTQGHGYQWVSIGRLFEKFAPYSAGIESQRREITVGTILSNVLNFSELVEDLAKSSRLKKEAPLALILTGPENQEGLATLFRKFGSDKSSKHAYHTIYSSLFPDASQVEKVLEIGLGTNSINVVSNMGRSHKGVGGSLRAFREYFPNASIFGADVDVEALFQEDRITTFWTDQVEIASMLELIKSTGGEIDLFIDDGLHSFNANINSLRAGLRSVKQGGFIVIEDIHPELEPEWTRTLNILSLFGHPSTLVRFEHSLMAVCRVGEVNLPALSSTREP